jgi:hypothetical protein
MKSFAEQLQDYINTSKNEKLNRYNRLKAERIRVLGHMFDLLIMLRVIDKVKSSQPLTSTLDQHMLAHILVNKHYKDPR